MKKKSVVFIFFVFLITSNSFAQTKPAFTPPLVIPPSPNAVSLGKFGEIPVSPYTGIPSISIPIYTISAGDLRLPISIDYHASGIRVDEESSWIGMGWSLNAGGMITKTVMGDDDFLDWGYIKKPWKIPDITSDNGFSGDLQVGAFYDPIAASNNPSISCSKWKYNGVPKDYSNIFLYKGERTYDTNPDIYHFNVAGLSGKFVLDEDGLVHVISKQKMEIKYSLSGRIGNGYLIDNWQIVLEDGTIYYFSNEETTKDYLGSEWSSGWWLDYIQSPSGEVITFHYKPYKHLSQLAFSQSDSYNGGPGQQTYSAPLHYKTQYLTDIQFRGGGIGFVRGEIREDLMPDDAGVADSEKPYRLKTIVVSGSNTIKSFDLFTSYFLSSVDGSHALSDQQPYDCKRLRLDSIIEDRKPPYKFIYNKLSLPPKTSFSKDYWGFNNGSNNTSLVPSYTGPLYGGYPLQVNSGGWYTIPGANRKAEPTKVMAASLEKIIYPTGGNTTFLFEANDYNDINVFQDYNVQASFSRFNQNQDASYSSGDQNITIPAGINPGSIKLIVEFNCFNCDVAQWPSGSIYFRLRSVDLSSNNPNARDFLYDPSDLTYVNGSTTLRRKEIEIDIKPGQYILQAILPRDNYSPVPEAIGTITLLYSAVDGVHGITSPGGGMRIKKITHSDGGSDAVNKIMEYQYGEIARDGKYHSFGKLMTPIQPWYFTSVLEPLGDGRNNRTVRYWEFLSGGTIPLGNSAQGSPIGYDKVIELNSTDGINGKTIYQYNNEVDLVFTYGYRIPNIPSLPWILNGKLKSKAEYKYDKYNWMPISEVYYVYERSKPEYVKGLMIEPGGQMLFWDHITCQFYMYYYPIACSWIKNTYSTETIFNQNDPSKFTINKKYFTYDPNDKGHMQLSRIDEHTSDGINLITNHTYALDYNNETDPHISNMLSRYNHNQVIESVTKVYKDGEDEKNAKIIKGNYNVYSSNSLLESYNTLEISKPIPDFMPVFPSVLPPKDRYQQKMSFSYSGKNLIFQKKTNDTPISYIWDNLYPVAEIKNATPQQVLYEGFEIGFLGYDVPGGKTGQKSYSTSYPVLLPSPGNYHLTYWFQKGSSPWTLVDTIISSNTTIGGNGMKIDEVRLYPIGAQMTTYTYAPLIGMTSKTDENNITTYFEYDAFQRLKHAKDRDGNIIKNYNYHYKGQP